MILLLNRSRLPTDDEAFQQYWEKIVDIDLTLSPNVDVNVAIVFSNPRIPEEYRQFASDVFKQLHCRNIRIHRRAAGLVKTLRADLADIRPEVQRDVVEHASLLCWAILDPSTELSDEVVGSERYGSLWLAVVSHGGARDQLSPDEERWARVIEQTGFSPAAFDKHLISYIKTGCMDTAMFREALHQANDNVAAAESQKRLYDAFRAYKSDLTLSREAYLERLNNALRRGLNHLNVFDFDAGVQSLMLLDAPVDEIVREYIDTRGDHLQAVAEAPGAIASRRIVICTTS